MDSSDPNRRVGDQNESITLSYSCQDVHAGAVSELLESLQPSGLRFELRRPPTLARFAGAEAVFTVQCPAFYVAKLRDQLSALEREMQAQDSW